MWFAAEWMWFGFFSLFLLQWESFLNGYREALVKNRFFVLPHKLLLLWFLFSHWFLQVKLRKNKREPRRFVPASGFHRLFHFLFLIYPYTVFSRLYKQKQQHQRQQQQQLCGEFFFLLFVCRVIRMRCLCDLAFSYWYTIYVLRMYTCSTNTMLACLFDRPTSVRYVSKNCGCVSITHSHTIVILNRVKCVDYMKFK